MDDRIGLFLYSSTRCIRLYVHTGIDFFRMPFDTMLTCILSVMNHTIACSKMNPRGRDKKTNKIRRGIKERND